jgi:hypothetical protein
VGPAQLEAAKQLLEEKFHAVLLSEWLDHAAQVRHTKG